jgi:GT2 family glycosyltransferase
MKVAVLLTIYNRKEKTLNCLENLYKAKDAFNKLLELDVYITDDGSTDGSSCAIKSSFPDVFLFQGTGNLFWTGGMRNTWVEVCKMHKEYDFYLLLNDDTNVYEKLFDELFSAHEYSVQKYKVSGIYIGSTIDIATNKISYGGRKLTSKFFPKFERVIPDGTIQECHLGNGNIMMVHKDVVAQIGILSEKYKHGIADFDYTLRAVKKSLPVLVCADYCGICIYDHGKNWKSGGESNLKQRIGYLKSPLGLSYNEFMYFHRTHFPIYMPVIFIKLWLKTFFPYIWDKLRD